MGILSKNTVGYRKVFRTKQELALRLRIKIGRRDILWRGLQNVNVLFSFSDQEADQEVHQKAGDHQSGGGALQC